MERVTILKPFGAPPEKGAGDARIFFLSPFYFTFFMGAEGTHVAPIFYLFFYFLSPPPKAAVPQMGAAGATPPEREGNPAEGASSRVTYNHV